MRWVIAAFCGLLSSVAVAAPGPWENYGPLGRDAVFLLADNPETKDTKMKIGASPSGTVMRVRVSDLATIWRAEIKNPRIWVFMDHSKDSMRKERESKVRFGVNCVAQTYAELSTIRYGPGGTVLGSRSIDDVSWNYEAIIPETLSEAIAKEVCP